MFYVWQVLRMIVVFIAAIRLSAYSRASESLLSGIIAGICFHVFYSILEAAHGVTQAGGDLGAQNFLGLVAHFALFPALALLLAGRPHPMAAIGLIAAVTVDVLTASRATLGLAAIGTGLLLAVSCARSFTARKGALLALAIAVTAILAPFAMNSIKQRSSANLASSNSERAAFVKAAWLIIADYPLGTGPNQYVNVANVGGYAARAGVNWNSGSRATNVHNSYLLVLAETGLLGLVGMLLLLAAPIVTAFRAAFRSSDRDWRGDVLLGLAVAMLTVSLHFLYEWLFVMFMVQ